MSDQEQKGSLPPSENGTNDIHVDSNSGYGENQQISPIHLFNPGTIVMSGTGPSNNSSTTADIYLSQSRPVNTLLTTASSSVLLRAPNVSDNSVTFDKYIESSITADIKLLDKHALPHYQRNGVNDSTLSLDLDEVEMAFLNDMILRDTDYDFAFDLQVNELKHAQTHSDDTTAVAVAAPPPPPPPSSSPSDTNGTNANENDIWICKEMYEAERRRDIDLWLRTLFPQNAKDAFPADDLSGLQEQLDKLVILKKLTLLIAMGNLYLVKKNEAIMDTMEDLYGADISIASLFNHGKRIVVQFDGHHQAFLKLQEFLFPVNANLLYTNTCTHNVFFCPIQHHLKESDLMSFCKRMDFPYGGLGEIHRKDACTNWHKSRTDVGDWFRIVANGERRCTKSGDKVSRMQHGHFVVRVADKSPQGRFHGFLFGIENSRPLDYTFGDGVKYLKGRLWMGMFDTGHGPAATKGPASVSGGWKRDLFMNLIGRHPDNLGGIRLHLDTHQVEDFYKLYALMGEDRHHYEALLNGPIGSVPRV